MMRRVTCLILSTVICLYGSVFPTAFGFVKGIYLTESTMENAKLANYFLKNAKECGLDTFVIDVEYKNTRFSKNIDLILKNYPILVSKLH